MNTEPELIDEEPSDSQFLAEVVQGLSSEPKVMSSKWLYDEKGSDLFEDICTCEDYYPTRTELSILDASLTDIAGRLGPRCLVVEPGSGAGIKTKHLLEALQDPVGWVPIEISKEHLKRSASEIAGTFPDLDVLPVLADFMQPLTIPEASSEADRVVVWFPGSTIGNFTYEGAKGFMARMYDAVGPGGALLIGSDLAKDQQTLERAYDDRGGITAAFNLNLLTRMNRELSADFDLGKWQHRAVWNADASRIEMHLVSKATQSAKVAGHSFSFKAGERIRTELSHKYAITKFQSMGRESGWTAETVWTDPKEWFALHLFTRP